VTDSIGFGIPSFHDSGFSAFSNNYVLLCCNDLIILNDLLCKEHVVSRFLNMVASSKLMIEISKGIAFKYMTLRRLSL